MTAPRRGTPKTRARLVQPVVLPRRDFLKVLLRRNLVVRITAHTGATIENIEVFWDPRKEAK